jgi:uncharacterized integral membrane protein
VSDLPTTPAAGGSDSRWRLYIAIGAIILAAIFILQNSQEVSVDFIFTTTETPLVFALLFAAILGFIIGLALPRFRQPRSK